MVDAKEMTEQEILGVIKDGLQIEEEGVLTFMGRRVIITPLTTFEAISAEGIDVLGLNGFRAMMYRAGLHMGDKVGRYLRDFLKMDGNELVYFYSMTAGKGRGWGIGEVRELDVAGGRYVATIKKSPWVAPFVEKKVESGVCSFSCGAVAGVMVAAGSPPIIIEETRCEAKGDEYCELVSRVRG
jgi:predicted hydrocarbon binding protein